MLDAQYKSDGYIGFNVFVVCINYAFTAMFTFELAVNVCANWFYAFLGNGWNLLDVIVVFMSLVDFGPFDVPDWLVRLIRALRVVRLFGRVTELTKMFTAIAASLFPMMNAFIILIIILSVCK